MAFLTDFTQKSGVFYRFNAKNRRFGCKFYSHKNCVSVKKMTIIRYVTNFYYQNYHRKKMSLQRLKQVAQREWRRSSLIPKDIPIRYSIWKNPYDCGFEFEKGWMKTRSSWLNCALRDDEAVYWVSIGHYEAVAVGKDTRNCQGQ